MNECTTSVGRVVCVCHQEDIETWRGAAPRIVSHIRSRRYVLLVPDAEVQLFRSVSPSAFEVIAESTYGRLFLDELVERMPGSLIRRRGWYVQQLLKLCALEDLEPDDVGVIWDADTVPLKQLSFIDRPVSKSGSPPSGAEEGGYPHWPTRPGK